MVVGSLDGSSVNTGGLAWFCTGAIVGLSSIGDSIWENVGVVGRNVL